MRTGGGGFLASCVLMIGCGGGDGTGPTTSHQLAGNWSYETSNLQDGHGATCSTTGTQLKLAQHAASFDGSALFGTISCTWPGGSGSGDLGAGIVRRGEIRGDSVVFDIDDGAWRSVGMFATADSMAGIVNAIYAPNGTQLILTGYWYAVRQP